MNHNYFNDSVKNDIYKQKFGVAIRICPHVLYTICHISNGEQYGTNNKEDQRKRGNFTKVKNG